MPFKVPGLKPKNTYWTVTNGNGLLKMTFYVNTQTNFIDFI
jgi:hypothetical protein